MIDERLMVIVAGVLGAMVGSFLNVCIYRWPNDLSVVKPRSRCGDCGRTIAWYDNIPMVSWFLLKGRCRWCGARVSIQYPLVELSTAFIWAWMAATIMPEWQALRGAVFFTILLGIALTDARQYIIPDEFSLGGLGLGLLFSISPDSPPCFSLWSAQTGIPTSRGSWARPVPGFSRKTRWEEGTSR